MLTGRGDIEGDLEAVGWTSGGSPIAGAGPLLDALALGPDPDGAGTRLAATLRAAPDLARIALEEPAVGASLVAVCGASRALSSVMARLGDAAVPLLRGPIPAPRIEAEDSSGVKREVGRRLLAVAAADLTDRIDMPQVGACLSDIADAAAVRTLSLVSTPAGAPRVAIIALGKWGGRELNYASDIDLVAVHDGSEEPAVATVAAFIEAMSVPSEDGIAFRCDLGLRPEGSAGPLSRTLDSYLSYWDRWADTWELQAMMKARFVAGDASLGERFIEHLTPRVFPETLGGDAVRSIRAMKRRAEALASDEGELKTGVGGIRDVEFAVQLLQLVHGRADPALRTANTIHGLSLLARHGYVAQEDADGLTDAYRWLRDVEHRLQLYDLRQTHTLPSDLAVRERVAKSMGYRDEPATTAVAAFDAHLVDRRGRIRAIHERLFYRPLLETFAEAPAATPEPLERQIAALGFTDTDALRTAVSELTSGLTRRSGLMRQLMPLLLGWLSESPDPDLGLAQLHRLAASGSKATSLAVMLRDDPVSGERLCRLLGTSRVAGPLVERLPTTALRLGDDERLGRLPEPGPLREEAVRRVSARDTAEDASAALRRFYAEHLLEASAADVAGFADERAVGVRLAAACDAVIGAALHAAVTSTGPSTPRLAVIGMGKLGGRELNYASDLDVLVVYRAAGEGSDETANRATERLMSLLGRSAIDVPLPEVDLALRPEGGKGALARSLEAYISYWDRWASTWEIQSLLRARPVAGDDDLAAEFLQGALSRATPADLDEGMIREIRSMKARVETERIPLGEDPDFHVKLGRGGMSDVEWTVQLLQMRHGAAHPGVLTPSTLEGITALTAVGALGAEDALVLEEAYSFCARVRNRLYHREGRVRDSLPTDPEAAARLAVSLGYETHPRRSLREDYRRITRRARRVVERLFYGR